MNYTLKEKIVITEELLNELIAKSWQEAENLQQQIANIDTSTSLGTEVAKLLTNTCTNHYVLIGCLETLLENTDITETTPISQPDVQNELEPDIFEEEPVDTPTAPKENYTMSAEDKDNFEPFEYFVDFDEPSGEPLSEADLYG